MKLKCRRCRSPYDLREAIKDEALVDIIRMLPAFGAQSSLIFEYVSLFDTVRPVRPLKLLRLLKEVRDIYTAERFTYHKRAYRISKKGFAEGLKMVCNRQFETPLTNHNYLKRILINLAEKEASEREKALLERERRLRAGERPGRDVKSRGDSTNGPASIGDVTRNLPWRKT